MTMSSVFKKLIFSALFCAVTIAVSGCGGGESAPEAGVLSPTKKQTPGEAIDTKSGSAAKSGNAATEKK